MSENVHRVARGSRGLRGSAVDHNQSHRKGAKCEVIQEVCDHSAHVWRHQKYHPLRVQHRGQNIPLEIAYNTIGLARVELPESSHGTMGRC